MDQWRFVPFFLVAFGSPLPPSVSANSTTELPPIEEYDYATEGMPAEVAQEASGSLIAGIVSAGFTLFTLVAIGLYCLWRMKRAELDDNLYELAEEKYAELVAAGKIPKNESPAQKAKRIRLEKEKEERRRRRATPVPVDKDERVYNAGLEETPSVINEKAITKKKTHGKLLLPMDVETADIETENMTDLLTKGDKDTETTVGAKVAIASELSVYKVEELDSARQVVPDVERNMLEREKIMERAPDEETAERVFNERQMARLERKKPTILPTKDESRTESKKEDSKVSESVKEDSKLDSGSKKSKFRTFFAKIVKKASKVPESPPPGTKKKKIAKGSKGTSSKKKNPKAPTKPSDSVKKDETKTTSTKKATASKTTSTSKATTAISSKTATTGPTTPPKTGTSPAATKTPSEKTETSPSGHVKPQRKPESPTSDTSSSPPKPESPSTEQTSSSRKQAIAGVKAEAGNKDPTITTNTGESASSTPPPATPKK